jgi:hypothetical protein
VPAGLGFARQVRTLDLQETLNRHPCLPDNAAGWVNRLGAASIRMPER